MIVELSFDHFLRRALYLSLIHDQYLVDLLTEQDVLDGRLDGYDVLYTADPCIADAAAHRIVDWVRAGGSLTGTAAAGSRNEFNEPASVLAEAFGIKPGAPAAAQPGRYHVRGALNAIAYTDRIRFEGTAAELGVIGVKASLEPTTGKVTGRFGDGRPAAAENVFGKGRASWIGACPGVAYVKEAKFVEAELKEKWTEAERRLINEAARTRGVARPVELSHAVVEAGVYDAPGGAALVLANFTYVPIDRLEVRLPVRRAPSSVRSVERGPLDFKAGASIVTFTLPLALTDVVLVE